MIDETDPRIFYQKEAKKYDVIRFSSSAGAYWSKLTIQTALNMISLKDVKDKIIADVGCGTGRFTIPIAHYAKKIYAIDTANSMLSILKKKAAKMGIEDKIETIISDAAMTNIRNSSIDFIISINVLSHLTHPKDVLSELSRILRPAGIFLFNYPNRDSLFFPVGFYVNQTSRALFRDVYTHWYQPSEVTELLRVAGLFLKNTRGLILPTNLPSITLQKLPIFCKSYTNPTIVRLCASVFALAVKKNGDAQRDFG